VDHRLPRLEQDIIISKKYGSAFFATSLAAQLQVLKIDTLLISGCVTSACVRASAIDAVQNGFRPIIVRETVGDRSVLAHEANLMDIEQRYGDVISMQEALQYLQSN
jgi:maleamate amidohydrolase